MRLETPPAIKRLISVFGLYSVADVRKKLPQLSNNLRLGEAFEMTCGGVYWLDVVNLVDVGENEILARAKFTYNASGWKGDDFIYTPELRLIKVAVRYLKYIVQNAIHKLQELGFLTHNEAGEQHLSDEE